MAGEETKVWYKTEGILLKEAICDPLLTAYSVIMIDEAHERTASADLLIAILKRILLSGKRPDLKVIVCSATLESSKISSFFAPIFHRIIDVFSRKYPISVEHVRVDPSPGQLLDALFQAIHFASGQLEKEDARGSILVFLSGRDEIYKLKDWIERSQKPKWIPLPLHAGLDLQSQKRALESLPSSSASRKIILSTNVAEASVTIEDVVVVIDSGFHKSRVYDVGLGIDRLVTTRISQSQSIQRAGRAGRLRPGKVLCLYSEKTFSSLMRPQAVPEIDKGRWETFVLTLKSLGIDNILHFDMLSPASNSSSNIQDALDNLVELGAIDPKSGGLTSPVGEAMVVWPLEFALTKSIFSSFSLGAAEEMISIAAMLNVKSIFICNDPAAKKRFAVDEGDHLTLLNVFQSFLLSGQSPSFCSKNALSYDSMQEASYIKGQLSKYVQRTLNKKPRTSASDRASAIAVRKAVCSGLYLKNVAVAQQDGSYRLLRESTSALRLFIHPESVLFHRAPPLVVFQESLPFTLCRLRGVLVLETTKPFMNIVTEIEQEWLVEMAPHIYESLV